MKKEAPPKRKTFTLRLDPELVKRLKHVAVDENVTIGVLIEDAIKTYLKQHKG